MPEVRPAMSTESTLARRRPFTFGRGILVDAIDHIGDVAGVRERGAGGDESFAQLHAPGGEGTHLDRTTGQDHWLGCKWKVS